MHTIYNPATNKWVKYKKCKGIGPNRSYTCNGITGKWVQWNPPTPFKQPKSRIPIGKPKKNQGKILNPKTGNMVNKNGVLGKKIMKAKKAKAKR
jgi:hypothetical protein